jgi:asparagine synthase (glutamine-hydrolysing)
MCGVFGSIGGTPPGPGTLAHVLALLRHRGPDAEGTATGEGFALAHTRLKVIDLSAAAAQPMRGPGETVLVFNGEVYNFRELREELVGHGHVFRSKSDTEVILAGYLRWGDAVVERLDGMFAFGLWDGRRRRLLLARDRTGKKPLFYRIGGGQLLFASEIKAILAAGAPLEVDPAGLVGLLSYGYAHPPGTLYKGISQLPPGCRLTFEPGAPRAAPMIERYWEPRFGDGPRDDRPRQSVLGELRRTLEDAVARRMVADVPVGAFLSGGVDSTIVVGLMSRLHGRVKTFSIGFAGDPRYDETSFARIAARAFGTEHTELIVNSSDFDLLDRLIWLHDGPFGDSSAVPTYLVSRLARAHVTVALTGDGGDELFAGYERLAAGAAMERVPAPLRRAAAGLGRLLPGGSNVRSPSARARRLLSAAALPLGDRVVKWNSYFALTLEELLRPELMVHASGVLAHHRDLFPQADRRSPLARLLAHNFATYLPYDLLVKADRSSMGNALELRSPLLDTQLVELAARLPDRMLVRGLTLKVALREACADLLPQEIARRGKMGFGMPLATWFRGELSGMLRDHLLVRDARIGAYVNPAAVSALFEAHQSGQCDAAHQLWLLLTLERWLRAPQALLEAPVEAARELA